MDYPLMLSRGRIGTLELDNRVVFPAMDAGLADNEGNERLARYLARRAEGGCGLIIVEVSAVHRSTAAVGEPRLYDDAYIPSYKNIADAVHAAGGKVAVQLWHAGRQLFAPDFDEFPDDWPKEIVSSSAIPCSEVVPYKPRELTTDEVYEIIEAFGQAGRRAKEAGFDCIEIHGAHGYLIDQFLNEYTNKRTDEFGGSFENRCRFGKLVIDSVRKNVGPDFPVIMRLNAFEGALQPGGIEIEDAVRAAKRFSAHGLDALDISQGSYDIEDIQVPAEVVVLGGGLVGLEATEILCEQGKHVTIVEMAGAVARDVAAYTQQHTRWMLQDYGVDIRVNTRVLSVGPDSITVSFDGRTHEIEAKAVVCALGSRPNNEVVDLVKGTGIPFGVIGDAKRPSKIINAVREANALARSI